MGVGHCGRGCEEGYSEKFESRDAKEKFLWLVMTENRAISVVIYSTGHESYGADVVVEMDIGRY